MMLAGRQGRIADDIEFIPVWADSVHDRAQVGPCAHGGIEQAGRGERVPCVVVAVI